MLLRDSAGGSHAHYGLGVRVQKAEWLESKESLVQRLEKRTYLECIVRPPLSRVGKYRARSC